MSLADCECTVLMDVPLALSTQISTVILSKKAQSLEFGPGCILPFLSLWFLPSQALTTAPETDWGQGPGLFCLLLKKLEVYGAFCSPLCGVIIWKLRCKTLS